MFWGCIVSESRPYVLPKEQVRRIIHISNAALSKTSETGKNYLTITKDNQTFTIGMLQRDKAETLFLDIYVGNNEDIKLAVIGKSEVSVIGYYEPDEELSEGSLDEEVVNKSKEGESDEEVENKFVIREDDKDNGKKVLIQEINSESEEDLEEVVEKKKRLPEKQLPDTELKKHKE